MNDEAALQGRPATTHSMRNDSTASRAEAFLRDVLARVVWARETFEPAERDAALEQLEHDLIVEIQRLDELDQYEAAA